MTVLLDVALYVLLSVLSVASFTFAAVWLCDVVRRARARAAAVRGEG